MQHQVELYLQGFERLNPVANVDLKKTLPCLGLIEDSQKSGSSLKVLCAQSIREVLRRPSESARETGKVPKSQNQLGDYPVYQGP
jgi:hypothetical protein